MSARRGVGIAPRPRHAKDREAVGRQARHQQAERDELVPRVAQTRDMRRSRKQSRLAVLVACCLSACEPGQQRGPDGLTEAEGRLVAGWMSVALVARARSTRLSDSERLDVLNEIGGALGEAAAPIFEQSMSSPEQGGPGGQSAPLGDVRDLFAAYAPVAFSHFRRTALQRPEAGPLQRAVIDRHEIVHGRGPSVDGTEDLPRRVEAPDGQLTLFADFTATAEAIVPLSLVNRTSAPVRSAQSPHAPRGEAPPD